MSPRTGALLALGCGGVLWLTALVADDVDFGPGLWVFPITAAVLGYRTVTSPGVIGAAVVALPLLLAGYTTPRGDEDGLWTLIFPFLVFFGLVSMLTAALGRRTATWRATRR